MKNVIILAVILAGISFSSAYSADGALVKIQNSSNEDFSSVTARIGGKEFSFADLKAGKATPYFKIGKTFLTGYFEVVTAKDTLKYSPSAEEIIKQEEYDKGHFIMELNIEVSDGHRQLTVKGYKK